MHRRKATLRCVKAAVTDESSPFAPVVGHPENVPVRRLGMIEEGGLDPPEPARNLQLSLVPHAALATEDEKPVLADVADDLGRRFSRVTRVPGGFSRQIGGWEANASRIAPRE